MFSTEIQSGTVSKLGYNMFGVIIRPNKVLYVHKFPPASGSNLPNLSVQSCTEELNLDDHLKLDTLLQFWSGKELKQPNGMWKGGEWGSNNLPTTDKTWCTGIFVGHTVKIFPIKQGIISFELRKGQPFDPTDSIISDSENFAWSCNIEYQGQLYSGYVCDKPMEQKALDVLFVWKNNQNKRYVKILRRNFSNPNLDMPELFMPGAGEHREPGLDFCPKEGVLRAVKEEIGIDPSILSECYMLTIGTFSAPRRDPRYWTFSAIQDGNIIDFGISRESSTDVYVLYIETDTESEPKEAMPLDLVEVGFKKWSELDGLVEKSDTEVWMIPEHGTYFKYAKTILDDFDSISSERKILKKIFL